MDFSYNNISILALLKNKIRHCLLLKHNLPYANTALLNQVIDRLTNLTTKTKKDIVCEFRIIKIYIYSTRFLLQEQQHLTKI